MEKIDWSILKRSITGDLTGQEKKEFDAWLNASEKNRQYYRKMEKFFARTTVREVDTAVNFRKFEQKTYKRKTRRLASLSKYAAVIVLLVGVVGLWKEFDGTTELQDSSSLAIVPGRERAELYTSKGEVIVLDNQMHKDIVLANGLVVRQDSNVLNYTDETSGKIRAEEIHQMRIPRGGEFKMLLSDGTRVYLNSETELSYPVRFQGDERRVMLSGEAYFDVKKSDIPFVVEVNGVEIQVLGTQFNVHAYKDRPRFETTLESGSVEVRTSEKKVLLKPGEQAVLEHDNHLSKRAVEVYRYTAWKDGQFVFDDERLEEVMNTVARWYDIQVFYQNPEVKNVRINGNISRYQDFKTLLEKLEKLDIVRFEINKRAVTIVGK